MAATPDPLSIFDASSFDHADPLARMKDEPVRANGHLRSYAEIGDNRSLRQLADATGTRLRTLEDWSSRWDWQSRVGAWRALVHRDVSLLIVERRAAEVGETLERLREIETEALAAWHRSSKRGRDAKLLIAATHANTQRRRALGIDSAEKLDVAVRGEVEVRDQVSELGVALSALAGPGSEGVAALRSLRDKLRAVGPIEAAILPVGISSPDASGE
jgi:hypothetical protein